jgi:hypothetical protein
LKEKSGETGAFGDECSVAKGNRFDAMKVEAQLIESARKKQNKKVWRERTGKRDRK